MKGKEGQCLLGAGVEEKYPRWRNRLGTQHIGPQAGADPHFVELNKLLRVQFKKNITNYKRKIIHDNVHLGKVVRGRGHGCVSLVLWKPILCVCTFELPIY